MTKRTIQLFDKLYAMGFLFEEAQQLRRIEMTLQRWGEAECGNGDNWSSWCVERDETTAKPYFVRYHNDGKVTRRPIPDRETGALNRLNKIMAAHPELVAYHQTDCRGCNLYILRKSDLQPGDKLDCSYTRGLAVCD